MINLLQSAKRSLSLNLKEWKLLCSFYIHGANRMGVLVGFNKEAAEAGKDVAMQIAAMNPLAVDETSISPETIAREKKLRSSRSKQKANQLKWLKRSLGKVNKFFKDNTL
jgi:elongation factor Ts